MTIKEIAHACRNMQLGETQTFELQPDQAAVDVAFELGTLIADFTCELDDDKDLVIHRTHIGPWPDHPYP